jgi:hypothetical protein
MSPRGVAAVVALLSLVGCKDQPLRPAPIRSGLSDADGGQSAADATLSDAAGIVMVNPDLSCQGEWRPGPLPSPWWLRSGSSECQSGLRHDPSEYYDDCESYGDPDTCGAPRAGAVFCAINRAPSHAGHLTQTCQVQGDCPPGLGCVIWGVLQDTSPGQQAFGQCEQLCSADEDCVRCGMACAGGFCQYPPPSPTVVPCEADCQCAEAGGVCWGGSCRSSSAPPRGLCPKPGYGDCACKGGTCGDDHCCRLPGGSIAGPDSAACQASQ